MSKQKRFTRDPAPYTKPGESHLPDAKRPPGMKMLGGVALVSALAGALLAAGAMGAFGPKPGDKDPTQTTASPTPSATPRPIATVPPSLKAPSTPPAKATATPTGSHLDQGLAYLKEYNYAEAVKQLQAAVKDEPDSRVALANLGVAMFNNDQMKDALPFLEKAAKGGEMASAEAEFDYAYLLTKDEKYEEAIPHYENAIRMQPDYSSAVNNLGIVLHRMGRFEEAFKYFDQALKLAPDSPMVHYFWGTDLEKQDKFKEAQEHYEAAIKIKPDYAEAKSALERMKKNNAQ